MTGKGVLRFIKSKFDPDGTLLNTGEFKTYNAVRKIMGHATVNHSKGEYVDDAAHANTIEGFRPLLKRAWYGLNHHYRKRNAPFYVAVACWKYNARRTENAFGAFMRECLA